MGLAAEAFQVRYRSIGVYLLIAVLLGGIYLFELRRKQSHIQEKITSTMMFKFVPSEVSSFVIDKGGVKIIATKAKENGTSSWKIISPIRAEAEPLRVQRFLDKLSNLRWQRKISEKPKDLEPFGLKHPAVVITVKADKASAMLRIGSQTPLGDDVYVQRGGDKGIYTISFSDKFDIDVDLFDLRDKRLITLAPHQIDRLTIRGKERGEWILYKEGDRWLFRDHQQFQANTEKVQALLSRLWLMRATSIEEEDAKDLSLYGLDKPRVKIRVWGGGKVQELWIGAQAKQGEDLYAKMADRSVVVTIKNWILSDIPPTPEGFRM